MTPSCLTWKFFFPSYFFLFFLSLFLLFLLPFSSFFGTDFLREKTHFNFKFSIFSTEMEFFFLKFKSKNSSESKYLEGRNWTKKGGARFLSLFSSIWKSSRHSSYRNVITIESLRSSQTIKMSSALGSPLDVLLRSFVCTWLRKRTTTRGESASVVVSDDRRRIQIPYQTRHRSSRGFFQTLIPKRKIQCHWKCAGEKENQVNRSTSCRGFVVTFRLTPKKAWHFSISFSLTLDSFSWMNLVSLTNDSRFIFVFPMWSSHKRKRKKQVM